MQGIDIAALMTLLCALVLGVTAQPFQHTFDWGWQTLVSPTSFEECQLVQVDVIGNFGTVAPYYMLAFEPGGVPTTSMIGHDRSNLWWQANHQRGSSLMLTMIDSNGSTGGVPQPLYDMTAGSNTSCLQSLPSSSAIVHANISAGNNLSTCDPLGITISGGQKPYTVFLAETDSPLLVVQTLSDDDDTFTYFNQYNPGWQIIASVYDASGQWGTSSGAIQTSNGSTAPPCNGLEPSQSNSTRSGGGEPLPASALPLPSGTSVTPPSPSSTPPPSPRTSTPIVQSSPPSAASARSSGSNHDVVGIAAGVGVGVGVPLLLAAILIPLFCWRRQKGGAQEASSNLQPGPGYEVEPWNPEPQMLQLHSGSPAMPIEGGHTTGWVPTEGWRGSGLSSSDGPSPTSAQFPYGAASMTPSSSSTWGDTKSHPTGFVLRPPSSSTAQSWPGDDAPGQMAARPSTIATVDEGAEGGSEPQGRLVQSHDGAAVIIRDIPPPYADVSRPSSSALRNEFAD
ncbi:hypothetical protein PsYK624_126210 [Phanerochaete sordida]|uniref:Transmembrane protein n=1 Tax=Phanerochaete sordida TaxID=48140 RepID=A0A9P3GN31_9APHY|nr:hypothetical protein PsYK624_126210 [Phanerochaete sordida]